MANYFLTKGNFLLAKKLYFQAEIYDLCRHDFSEVCQSALERHKSTLAQKTDADIRKKFDFLVVPTSRGASTAFIERANLHPHLSVLTKQEIDHAISTHNEKDLLDKYQGLLQCRHPHLKVGIIQHGYIAGLLGEPDIAKRLSQVVDNTCFIQSVRDPLSIVRSVYKNQLSSAPELALGYSFYHSNANTIFGKHVLEINEQLTKVDRQIAVLNKRKAEVCKISSNKERRAKYFSQCVKHGKHFQVGSIYNKYFCEWSAIDAADDFKQSPGLDIVNLMKLLGVDPDLRLIHHDSYSCGYLSRIMLVNYLEIKILGYNFFVFFGHTGTDVFGSTFCHLELCRCKNSNLAQYLNASSDSFSLYVSLDQWLLIPFKKRKIIINSGVLNKILEKLVLPHWLKDYRIWLQVIYPYYLHDLTEEQFAKVRAALADDLEKFLKIHPQYEQRWASVKTILG